MKIYILFLYIFILACNNGVKKKNKENNSSKNQIKKEAIMEKDSIDINIVLKLTKSEALVKYGIPKQQDHFVLNDALSEFRIELFNIYTKEQRQGGSIRIEEITWSKNTTNNITIWYENKNEDFFPVHYLIWNNEKEF